MDESEGGITGAGVQAAAVGAALRDPAGAAEARSFMREQSELSRLQRSTPEEEAKLNLSHLHFRGFGDFTKTTFEIAGGLLALFVVIGPCAIQKFREANTKSLHFANTLEMWGDALMQKSRSDLARVSAFHD